MSNAASLAADGPIGAAAPRHVAIVMDGNGRWAKARGLPRQAGHERGVEALRKTIEGAEHLGIRYLTVYSFSTENWRRPKQEVDALFGLLRAYIKRDLSRLKREGVHVKIIGKRSGLPDDIAELVDHAERETAANSRFILTIAFNYGGRDELVRAASSLAADVAEGRLKPHDVNEAVLSGYLDTADLPDPDLVIRTSGELRISNFLIWQTAYSEFVFQDVLWPDFTVDHLKTAISAYQARERRYGGVRAAAT